MFTDMPQLPERAQAIYKLWEEGSKREAFKNAKNWMKEEKGSSFPKVVMASLYFQKGKYKKCLRLCKKAIKKSPQIGEAYFWRGRAYEALKKPMEAANEYRAALYAKQEFYPAQEGLDRVLAKLNEGVSEP